MAPCGKRMRVMLTLKQKLDICHRLEKGEKPQKLMQEYGIGISTLYDIKHQSAKLEEFLRKTKSQKVVETCCTLQVPILEDLEKALYDWLLVKQSEGMFITGLLIIEKAKEIYKKMNVDVPFDFTGSWLFHFKDRHGIRLSGEQKPADKASIDKFCERLEIEEDNNNLVSNLSDNESEFLGFQSSETGGKALQELQNIIMKSNRVKMAATEVGECLESDRNLPMMQSVRTGATTELDATHEQLREESDCEVVEKTLWNEAVKTCSKALTFMQECSLTTTDERTQIDFPKNKLMKEGQKTMEQDDISTGFSNIPNRAASSGPQMPESTSTTSEMPPSKSSIPEVLPSFLQFPRVASIHLHCPRDTRVHIHRHDSAFITFHLGTEPEELCGDLPVPNLTVTWRKRRRRRRRRRKTKTGIDEEELM